MRIQLLKLLRKLKLWLGQMTLSALQSYESELRLRIVSLRPGAQRIYLVRRLMSVALVTMNLSRRQSSLQTVWPLRSGGEG